jgi:signal peptidase II
MLKYFISRYYPAWIYNNQGVIFGWVQNQLVGYILLAFGILLLIYVIIQQQKQGMMNYLAITLIASGAAANLVDRLRFGYVVDYIHFFNLNVFNLADIYIFIGILLYAFVIFRTNKR